MKLLPALKDNPYLNCHCWVPWMEFNFVENKASRRFGYIKQQFALPIIIPGM